MKKLVTLFGLVGIVNFAAATTVIDRITGDDLLQSMKRHSANADCANFAGKWKGVCLAEDGKKKETEFEIKQNGCDSIGMKDKEFLIGGIADLGITVPATAQDPSAVGRATIGFVWGEGKQSLVVDVFGTRKALGTTKDAESKSGAAEMKLAGSKLLLTWKEGTTAAKQVCEFDKQP